MNSVEIPLKLLRRNSSETSKKCYNDTSNIIILSPSYHRIIHKENVVSLTEDELTDRQRLVFLQIEHNNYVTTAKMSEALKVTTRTIDRELAVLRKLGYIVKANKDNKSPWLVLKRPK